MTLASGTAVLSSFTFWTKGTQNITALPSGGGLTNGVSANVTVNAATSTTTVSSSQANTVFGQSVTFTATVSGTVATPTGTVTFKDGATTLGTATLTSGQATFTTSSLTIGSHSITAVYGGNNTFNGSTSAALTQSVSKGDTSVALVSSLNPACFGASVTFTSTVSVVSPGTGTPTGTVTFKDGATTLATVTLSSGKATYSSSALSVASHSITAAYSGDGSFNTNTSAVLTQTVNARPTATVSGGGTICQGSSTTVQAALTGAAPWTVVWSDGVTQTNILASPATRSVSPSSNTTYTVTSVSDANCSGTASGSATLTVNFLPTITSQPASQGVCATYSASFSVTATGTGIGYQWRKNGTNLVNGGSISGATNSTLTINPTSPSDSARRNPS